MRTYETLVRSIVEDGKTYIGYFNTHLFKGYNKSWTDSNYFVRQICEFKI